MGLKALAEGVPREAPLAAEAAKEARIMEAANNRPREETTAPLERHAVTC